MVISVLEHGLGNQLFQYAAGRAVAERLRTTLFLDKMRYAYNDSRELGITKFRIRARLLPDRIASLMDIDEDARGVKSVVRETARKWIADVQGFPSTATMRGFPPCENAVGLMDSGNRSATSSKSVRNCSTNSSPANH